jgi:hypothetical protein
MKGKQNYYTEVISILQHLHKDHPTYNIGRHLSTALDEYGNLWGITDKEILFALTKYMNELSLDFPHTEDVDDIIKDGCNLDNILEEGDNDDRDY